MKWYRLIIVSLVITFLFIGASYCEVENDEIDTGLPLLQKIIGTDEHILADDSAKYCFDGKKEFLTPNILEDLANICFTVYKFFIQIEIILVALSYKLELFTLMKDQIAVLMKPITVVFYDTWKIPVLLILLLFIMIKSLNSKNTYVIGQVVIAGFVLGISIIFLGNPVGTLEVGYDVVSSMNEMILKESSIAGGNTDDYIVNLCNQLWIAQVEKPWEILNFNNKTNANKYKSEFLKYNHGTEERDKLTEELRENVPEQGYNWVATSFFIGIIQSPKIAVIVILSVLNLGTDVMIVLLTIVSGIIFLLSLVPGFGVGVLLKWFEKIVSAFVVSVLVTSALTILNEFSSLLYGQVDRFNVLGVLIIELVIMLFLIIFRGWIFSGIRALRHGERGAKAAIENTPGSKHVFDTTSSFMKEDMYSSRSSKAKEEPSLKFWHDGFRNKSESSDNNSSNSGSKYKESDSGSRSNNQNSKGSSSEYYKYYNYKRKQERKDKEQANGKSDDRGNDSSKTNDSYIRFSDYDEKEKIHSKYEPEIITDEMTKEEQARVYLNNQLKDVLREKEIFETTNVTLGGKAKEFKVDSTTSKILDRQKKGEPLFTDKEVFRASVYIENSSSDKNISRSEFANTTSGNLLDILSKEKKYSANDTKETFDKSQTSSGQSEEDHSQKDSSNNNFDEEFRKSSDNQQYYEDFYNKHKGNKESHDEQEEHEHSEEYQDEGDDFEYREHYKSSSYNDSNNMKTEIKEITVETKNESEDELKDSIKTIIKETLSQELSKGRNDSRGSKFDEILKNDIEEKREVEEINKKLDKIEKKVDKDSTHDTVTNHKTPSFENSTANSKAVSLGDYDEKD